MSDKLSVLIPARNEQFLQKTIDCVLAAAEEDIEIIAVCDGYWPNPGIKDDPRVILVHHTESRGQRQSINEAARIAQGKYIMKLDAHCSVGPGFDRILKADCKYEWTMVPRMHNLDIATFQPKFIEDPELGIRRGKVHDYMYISGPQHEKPFRAMYYGNYGGAKTKKPKSDKLIDETMCCMGPGWFMHKDRFWEQGGCDEGHGGWGQQGVEVSLKAWLSGGALMVNKKTWFAHWFRGGDQPPGFKKGFPYSISGRTIENARKYSRDLWLNNKWDKQVRTIEWLVDKFKPATWNDAGIVAPNEEFSDEESRKELYAIMYRHIHRRKNDVVWRGIPMFKFPTDLCLYHETLFECKPDYIVEIGTKYGASALFFQDTLDMCGNGGKVITIDIKDQVDVKDPRIEYIVGNSIDDAVVDRVKGLVSGSVMVVIDGNHNRGHVKWELVKYGPIVTKGQYMVVEDCYIDRGLYGPGEARDWFLRRRNGFVETDTGLQTCFEKTRKCRKYLVGVTMGGWLKAA